MYAGLLTQEKKKRIGARAYSSEKKHITNTPPDAVKLYWSSLGFPETQFVRAQRSAPRSAQLRTHLNSRSGALWPSLSWKQLFTCSETHKHKHTHLPRRLRWTQRQPDWALTCCCGVTFLPLWRLPWTRWLMCSGGEEVHLNFERSRSDFRKPRNSARGVCSVLILTTMSHTVCVENLKACCSVRGAKQRASWKQMDASTTTHRVSLTTGISQKHSSHSRSFFHLMEPPLRLEPQS